MRIFIPLFTCILLLISCGKDSKYPTYQSQEGQTQKPVIHAKHWLAIAGKPISATAGSMIFQKGGNAIDAACAMLGASATMWDKMAWGGETQALIYNPNSDKVIGINALGVAPTGATADFFLDEGMNYPSKRGPLAAVTPGTPGGLLTMLAEYGTMSLKQILAPSIEMTKGFPMGAYTANRIEDKKKGIKKWPYSKKLFLTHLGEDREAPHEGEIFVQNDLYQTLNRLVEAEEQALAEGKSRKEAIYAAYDRFYRGDIAEEIVKSVQKQGGLFTMEDLDKWQVYIEEPEKTSYKGIDVYKLQSWVQGPVLLQQLNMIEQMNVKEMGYNSPKYLHTLYQVMNLTFADRDFYYGDPYFEPKEPIEGLLSKEYAKERVAEINWEQNDPQAKPGNPYPYIEGNPTNPYLQYIKDLKNEIAADFDVIVDPRREFPDDDMYLGTTSIIAADKEGWVISITPSGGWAPAVVAGETGIGLSQRMQSFVLEECENPFNVVEPGKRPNATLTPTMTLKEGKPFMAFAVQGGDSQEQNLLQFFLNVVEFGMNIQEAAEAPNMNTYQLRSSFGEHEIKPGVMLISTATPPDVRAQLDSLGYKLQYKDRTSGPLNGIFFDWEQGSFWGGSSNHGDDYGIGW